MRDMRKVFVAVVVAGAFASGWAAHRGWLLHLEAEKAENLRLLDHGGAIAPLWVRLPRCRPPTTDEVVQDRAALAVLRAFRSDRIGMLGFRAVEHFSNPGRRARGQSGPEEAKPCLGPDLIAPIVDAAVVGGAFDSTLYEPGIGLAEQLGPRHPKVVQAVARTAFASHLIPSDFFRTDLRPYARLVLAEYGAEARPYGAQAFAQISANDSLGTGAAQVAVAAGQPGALQRVQELMTQLLDQTPADEPIPRLTRNRLYELAFALGMAGPDAEPYAGPLVQLMGRKVESSAPPFGLLSLPPARMCPVALRIGGAAASAAAAYDFCGKEWKTLEN